MGIREIGYRHWDGKYKGHGFRWWTIARQGMRSTLFNRMRLVFILIFVFVAWAPFLMAGIMSFFAGAGGGGFECSEGVLRNQESFSAADDVLRCNLYDLFRGWQFLMVPPFVAMVAAPLISSDLRTNAMYIYLSKPVRRVDYLLGKLASVLILGTTVTVLPTIFLWLMAVASQNELSKLDHPYVIFWQSLALQVLLLVFLTVALLAISSFVKQWHIAMYGFIGGWIGLWVIANIVVEATRERNWFLVSLVDNFINIAQELLDVRRSTPDFALSPLIIGALLVIGAVAFVWRVSRMEVGE